LIQEFIFGHGNDYMEKLNKSRVRYYNDYLLELYNYMQVNDLLDNTTIVVVSDHGDKGYMQKSIDSYKIPMVVVNNNLEYKEIDDLKSHVDFKDILLSYFGGFNYTSQSEGRFLIGQTQSREVGYIDLNGDYFLTKRVGDGEYVVRNASDVSVNFISDKLKVFENWRLAMVEKNFEGNYYCFNCD
jgi:membrane-anchored protein YejM (alkaline phosphatase superfamily)